MLLALVPLVAFAIFVIATHRDSPAPLAAPASAPAQSSPGVIFVTPVSAPANSAH